jgi:hypothetical protein
MLNCGLSSSSARPKMARQQQKKPVNIKIVMKYFFTALSIEGHQRVPSLVGHVLILMRFNAFRMDAIEIRLAGPLGPNHGSF